LLRQGIVTSEIVPDFLSLDTQGTEYEIMIGAEGAISANVLGIATEIEFAQMYRDQKLFPAIFEFVQAHGFHFAGFSYLQDVMPSRVPLGSRGKGFLAFGDALFLRRCEALRAMCASDEEFVMKGMKLAFIAIVFDYLPYAIHVLDAISEVPLPEARRAFLQQYRYIRFLGQLHSICRSVPRRVLYDNRDELVLSRRASPSLKVQAGLAKILPSFVTKVPRSLAERHIGRRLRAQISRRTPIEKLLHRYGFKTLAAEVRFRRVVAEPFAE